MEKIFAVSYGIGIACLGAAACLLIPSFYVSPSVGNLFVIVAFTIVVLALASFNSADPPTAAVAVPNEPPLNLCGRFGAAIAYRLYEVFGLGVWIPVLYLGTLLAFLASGRALTHPFVRFVGACVMMVAAGGLHDLAGNQVYVTPGIGREQQGAPQIRFLAPPEVALLTLAG